VQRSGIPARDADKDELLDVHVLIVEDDEDVSDLLARHLTALGARVTLVESGEEAVSVLRDVVPDLVISDIVLPGIDGRHLFDILRGEPITANTPVIAATVLDEQDLGRHFDACISKPFGRADVVRIVGPYLAAAREGGSQ
jgi:CheY-like chemotaxis protein